MSGRLAAVLARALLDTFCWDRKPDAVAKDAEAIVRAIPEPERDAIEAALDRCQWRKADGWAVCGGRELSSTHHHDERHGWMSPHESTVYACHPYQPLVAP